MKKLLTYFFCSLGVIFFLLICTGAYLWFADPYEIRPLISVLTDTSTPTPKVADDGVEIDKNSSLSASQETALERVGIDPANVPTSITPTQEECFIEKFGSARVQQIKDGASPTPQEVFAGRSCIQ